MKIPNPPKRPNKFVNTETGSEFTLDDIENMIDASINVMQRMTDYEADFISNIADSFSISAPLTEKQLNWLERIYAKYTK